MVTRLFHLNPVTWAGLALACSGLAALSQVKYPGVSPGPAELRQHGGRFALSNQVLCAAWQLRDGHFQAESFRRPGEDSRRSLTGEVFQVVLANGEVYSASSLVLASRPRPLPARLEANTARLGDRVPGRQVELAFRSRDNLFHVRWRAILRDNAGYLRQELEITPQRDDALLKEVRWWDEPLSSARAAGAVDGSPVVAGDLYLGIEDPHALNEVLRDGHVRCRLVRNAPLRRGATLTQSFVLGVAPTGQMRRAFLHYLEHERAHPYRPFLHYNSWYDTAWEPFALNETNCLEAIRLFGERFIEPYAVTMDALVFDDGWDNPRTLWQFHSGFPNGFAPLARACAQYHSRLGVWLSPFGGYGESRNQRLKFGAEQGYETNAVGFSLAGPKYYAAFRDACVQMIRKYRVNHFKFDGIATGAYARGAAEYTLDTEAMRRLMLDLRREDKDLYINLTTGSWPSPFWLRYADSVWRQGGDMGLAGTGPRQQQWLTYRDQETFRNIVTKGPLYPLNSLMTQGVAYSRKGTAGDPTFDSSGFKADVRAFFASGTGLQELYIQPGKLTPSDWQVLAEAAKWSRANADVLVDTHWVGGDPSSLEVYGYGSWTRRKGILMLRNPSPEAQEFALDLAVAFELAAGDPTVYLLKSPWAEDAALPVIQATAGRPSRLKLKPFEVLVFDAAPGT